MQIYMVGGAVRDELLGVPVKDRDWVVVGARPEQLLHKGFRPVGKDFPVFLHPRTQEEYALARTERKSGHGYKGFEVHFAPEVSLEEDLLRRDLTINAMARGDDGALVDPYGGQADLQARVLRHVSPAFAEDPVRILRVARFAARFDGFTVAPETLALMRAMVDCGEVDHLVAERVWQELARGLMEARPRRMLEVLRDCGALARILPELEALFGVPQPPQWHPEGDAGEHTLQVVDAAAHAGAPLAVRWACLLHDLGKGSTPTQLLPHHYGHEARSEELARAVSERIKVPVDCRDLAVLLAREHGVLHKAGELRPATVVQLLERCDALRRPERFELLLQGAACDRAGRCAGVVADGAGPAEAASPGDGRVAADCAAPDARQQRLLLALQAARGVDGGAVARACADKSQIPARIHEARVAAVRAAWAEPVPS